MKEAIIALLVGYVLVSWSIALGFVIKLLIVKKTNKHKPLLLEECIKANIIAFGTGLWLPMAIININC